MLCLPQTKRILVYSSAFERRPPVWLSSALPRRRRARPRPDGRLARVHCASRDPARARGAGAPHLQPSRALCVRATPATIPARPLSHSTPACHAKVHDPNLPATNTQPLHTTHRSTRRALCPIRRPLTAHTTPAHPAPSHSAHNQGLPTAPRPKRAPQSGQSQRAIHRLPRALYTAHGETRPIPDARSSSSPQPGTPSPLPHTPRQNPSHNPPFGREVTQGARLSALLRAKLESNPKSPTADLTASPHVTLCLMNLCNRALLRRHRTRPSNEAPSRDRREEAARRILEGVKPLMRGLDRCSQRKVWPQSFFRVPHAMSTVLRAIFCVVPIMERGRKDVPVDPPGATQAPTTDTERQDPPPSCSESDQTDSDESKPDPSTPRIQLAIAADHPAAAGAATLAPWPTRPPDALLRPRRHRFT